MILHENRCFGGIFMWESLYVLNHITIKFSSTGYIDYFNKTSRLHQFISENNVTTVYLAYDYKSNSIDLEMWKHGFVVFAKLYIGD